VLLEAEDWGRYGVLSTGKKGRYCEGAAEESFGGKDDDGGSLFFDEPGSLRVASSFVAETEQHPFHNPGGGSGAGSFTRNRGVACGRVTVVSCEHH
jgi:hypothetical protein